MLADGQGRVAEHRPIQLPINRDLIGWERHRGRGPDGYCSALLVSDQCLGKRFAALGVI